MPVEPQRVVVLHQSIAEVMVVLGVEPLAIGTDLGEAYPYLEQRLPEDIENVGEPPNLEALLALEPDLIIGFDNLFEAQENYAELSQIAPTVGIRHGATSAEWKRTGREVAEALGKTEEFEPQLTAYEARATEIGRRLGVPDSAPTAAIMLTWDGTAGMRFDLPRIFSGSVLYEDVGVPLPEGLRETAAAGEWELIISRERFDQGDGDKLFLYSQSSNPEQLIEEIREDPLFQILKAVESGNVYTVESYWFNGGLVAANLILDDLEQLLLEGKDA
ncbi:MAG: iron-siderophore ABC transporter substrate-binding protein [Chloroflexota bacterium]